MATAKKRDFLWFITAPGHVQVAVIRNVCCRCGKHFNGEGVECEPCQKLRAAEEKNAKAAERRYWREHFTNEKAGMDPGTAGSR